MLRWDHIYQLNFLQDLSILLKERGYQVKINFYIFSSSDTCSSSDESESDEEETVNEVVKEENYVKELKENKEEKQELEDELNKIAQKLEDKPAPVMIEKNEFNYSNEFVKKSTPDKDIIKEESQNLDGIISPKVTFLKNSQMHIFAYKLFRT